MMTVAQARAEHGSALLIAMILLFITTALGISSMQGSSLEFQMATNAIQSKTVFQVAESATEEALNSTTNISQAFDAGVNGQLNISMTLDDLPEIQGDATLRYVGSGLVPGSSVGVFEGLRFEVYGTAALDGEVRAGVTQGAIREVPAN